MKADPPRLDSQMLATAPIAREQDFAANGMSGVRGRYSTFEFVLRLSDPIHARLAALPSSITSNAGITFELKWLRDFVSHPVCTNAALCRFVASQLASAVIPPLL